MQAIINISPVDTQLAPGQTLGDWVIDIVDATGAVVQSQAVSEPVATFSLADGTYTAQAKRLDSTGALFGSVSTSDPFTLTTPVVMGQSAGTVTVTIG